ncbi:hypothetical protein TVAG_264990 [Trichomonas vaginalis G3]|uniref:Uncharacterized protein n=1 Tax=Trichomonas vaginalis (strain ATCC PRA-98 / G3) TaxID=412133 RepID=A2FVQ0_TRIV3|nr:hypothetical protein TVAGG3_0347320 [Trichomonas vaginalis G3]EAX91022.1 hypothetical protein TVAG_264990 [Trichomonas vaginalis G3]KAI5531054.1 hypothetical protein TVAGG3_0347320 [Trichomonas vaginalis G3]|eukprot:XP_001303952.1 hypothetical protein [Trichomonas vaginalis G3]
MNIDEANVISCHCFDDDSGLMYGFLTPSGIHWLPEKSVSESQIKQYWENIIQFDNNIDIEPISNKIIKRLVNTLGKSYYLLYNEQILDKYQLVPNSTMKEVFPVELATFVEDLVKDQLYKF